jgi:hypothetical protein
MLGVGDFSASGRVNTSDSSYGLFGRQRVAMRCAMRGKILGAGQ